MSDITLVFVSATAVEDELFVCCPVKTPCGGEWPHHPHVAVASVTLWGQLVGSSYCQSQQLLGFFFVCVLPK